MDFLRFVHKVQTKIGIRSKKDITLHWQKRDSTSDLESIFSLDIASIQPPPMAEKIENLARLASQLGEMPLWEGFEKLEDYPFPVKNATRNANQVRVDQKIGNLFYYLVCIKKPKNIVEIGTAFGVSGMYWLSGIAKNNLGKLFTFEPNAIWAKVAESNLRSISKDFLLTVSTFEEQHDKILKSSDKIDIAFIDAIHIGEVVHVQFNLIAQHAKSSSLILFDDINFSDDMWNCWKEIATSEKVKASCTFSERLGIVELN